MACRQSRRTDESTTEHSRSHLPRDNYSRGKHDDFVGRFGTLWDPSSQKGFPASPVGVNRVLIGVVGVTNLSTMYPFVRVMSVHDAISIYPELSASRPEKLLRCCGNPRCRVNLVKDAKETQSLRGSPQTRTSRVVGSGDRQLHSRQFGAASTTLSQTGTPLQRR